MNISKIILLSVSLILSGSSVRAQRSDSSGEQSVKGISDQYLEVRKIADKLHDEISLNTNDTNLWYKLGETYYDLVELDPGAQRDWINRALFAFITCTEKGNDRIKYNAMLKCVDLFILQGDASRAEMALEGAKRCCPKDIHWDPTMEESYRQEIEESRNNKR